MAPLPGKGEGVAMGVPRGVPLALEAVEGALPPPPDPPPTSESAV